MEELLQAVVNFLVLARPQKRCDNSLFLTLSMSVWPQCFCKPPTRQTLFSILKFFLYIYINESVIPLKVKPGRQGLEKGLSCIFQAIGLLLGRKVVTKLDSILKTRDITLLTNFCLVKPMVFSVVMYGYDSWTILKKEKESWALKNWCF